MTKITIQIDLAADIGDWGNADPGAVHEAHASLVQKRLAHEFPLAQVEVELGVGRHFRVQGAYDDGRGAVISEERVEDGVRAALVECWDDLCGNVGIQQLFGVAA